MGQYCAICPQKGFSVTEGLSYRLRGLFFLIKVPLSAPISAAFFVMDDTKGGKTGVWSATMKGPLRARGNNCH